MGGGGGERGLILPTLGVFLDLCFFFPRRRPEESASEIPVLPREVVQVLSQRLGHCVAQVPREGGTGGSLGQALLLLKFFIIISRWVTPPPPPSPAPLGWGVLASLHPPPMGGSWFESSQHRRIHPKCSAPRCWGGTEGTPPTHLWVLHPLSTPGLC